jgi:hypothetical protein
VFALMSGGARCPACGAQSSRRHGWCVRHLQDLPAQGAPVKLMLRVARWRCLNPACVQMTFGDRLSQIVAPYSLRTRRVVDLARLLAHTAGGRPACRLMARLRAPQSKDTLLRSLKRGVNEQAPAAPVRVVGVDDWSWRNRAPSRQLQLDPQEIVDLQEPPGLIHRYGQPGETEHRHLVQAGRRGRHSWASTASRRCTTKSRRWPRLPEKPGSTGVRSGSGPGWTHSGRRQPWLRKRLWCNLTRDRRVPPGRSCFAMSQATGALRASGRDVLRLILPRV